MRVTAKVDYALRAALELTTAPPRTPMKSEAIAEAQAIPLRYMETILLTLRRSGIVSSQRGADGGYWLARKPSEISVADIIRAVEGPLANVQGERPEVVHFEGAASHVRDLWVATRAALRSVLDETSLEALAAGELTPATKALLADPASWEPR